MTTQENVATATPATNGETRPVRKVRTNEELKAKGIHGNLYVLIKLAFELSKKNAYKGTGYDDKKYIPTWNTFVDNDDRQGSYWRLDEKSDTFKKLLQAGKDALKDLNSKTPKYSKAVQEFCKLALSIPSDRVRGEKDFSAILADIKL